MISLTAIMSSFCFISDELKNKLGPHVQKQEQNCIVREPDDITTIELSTAKKFSDIQLQKLNGDCASTVQTFESKSLQSICHTGNYTCKSEELIQPRGNLQKLIT